MQLPVELVPGQVYRRVDLHSALGGQQQGGISTPREYPLIMLFTSDRGLDYGYQDKWGSDGSFFYTGEGQRGDMAWVRGNAAIRDHLSTSRDLTLFSEVRKGHHRFAGFFACVGWQIEPRPHIEGSTRSAFIFELAPVGADVNDPVRRPPAGQATDLETLRTRARQASKDAAPKATTGGSRTYRERSQAVVEYVLARAAGICEACGQPAPFTSLTGRPFLEAHHVIRIADEGPDSPEFVAAICPNCHREIHHGVDGVGLNSDLADEILRIEMEIEQR